MRVNSYLNRNVWNLSSLFRALMKRGQRGRLLKQLCGVSRLPGPCMQKCGSPQRTPHAMAVTFPGRCSIVTLSDNAHVVAPWAPTGNACGHLMLRYKNLWDLPWWHLPWLASTRSPCQRAAACRSAATEAGQLAQLFGWAKKTNSRRICCPASQYRLGHSAFLLIDCFPLPLWERNSFLFSVEGQGRNVTDGSCACSWWGHVPGHQQVRAGSPRAVIQGPCSTRAGEIAPVKGVGFL